jgi:Domain of unknown function (DUF1707)
MERAAGAEIRASDEERQQTADRLREHFAAGRLSLDEFEERLRVVYASKTRGDLDATTSDLPPPAPPAVSRGAGGGRARRAFAWEAFGVVTLFLACVAIWVASGRGQFWPIWVAIVGGLRLARSAQRHLGPGRETHWRALERRRRRDERRHQLPPPP